VIAPAKASVEAEPPEAAFAKLLAAFTREGARPAR